MKTKKAAPLYQYRMVTHWKPKNKTTLKLPVTVTPNLRTMAVGRPSFSGSRARWRFYTPWKSIFRRPVL